MILLLISGRDKPGVSAALFEVLGKYNVSVLEIEQVVIRNRLILAVEINGPEEIFGPLLLDTTSVMQKLEMRVDIDLLQVTKSERIINKNSTHSLVILGQPITTTSLAALSGYLSKHSININAISSVADYPVIGLEFRVNIPENIDEKIIRKDLAKLAREHNIDIATEKEGLTRRSKRMIVFDVDSTLIQGEVIEMIADHAGSKKLVEQITDKAMRGEIDFTQSLHERVSTFKNLPETVLSEVTKNIVLTPGARTTIRTVKRMGYKVGLVSGGFHQVIDPIAKDLDVDFVVANNLEISDGFLTGNVVGQVVDKKYKATALKEYAKKFAIDLEQTVAVGDGANDVDMIAAAGLGIAFRAKPILNEVADAAISYPYLDSILFILGINRRDLN